MKKYMQTSMERYIQSENHFVKNRKTKCEIQHFLGKFKM